MIGHQGKIFADGGEQSIGVQECTHFEGTKFFDCIVVPFGAALEGRHGDSPCKCLIAQGKLRPPPQELVKRKVYHLT